MSSTVPATMKPEPEASATNQNATQPDRKSAAPYAEIKTYDSTINIAVSYCDLDRLQPGRWLNNHLLNYVTWGIANTYAETRLLQPKEISFQPTITCSTRTQESSFHSYSKVNPLQSEFVVLPLNVQEQHWILAILAFAKSNLLVSSDPGLVPESACTFHVLDSLPNSTRNIDVDRRLLSLVRVMGDSLGDLFLGSAVDKVPIIWHSAVSALLS